MPIRAVILDYDGVIIDSAREGRRRLLKILRARDYPTTRMTRQQIKNGWGTQPVEFLKNYLGLNPAVAAEINEEWEQLDAADSPLLIPGALKILKWLGRMGFKVALLTSRRRQSLLQSLTANGLGKYFDYVQSQNDWRFVKPDPRAFQDILNKLEKEFISPQGCLYAGDTPVDFVAASGAGIENLSVLTGIFSKNDFVKIGQKKRNIIDSIASLPAWIKKHQDC